MNITHETVNGVNVTRIGDDAYHYAFGYYSSNKWPDDHRIVLSRQPVDIPMSSKFYIESEAVLVDIQAQTEDVLGTFIPAIVHGHILYGIEWGENQRCLFSLDINTRARRDLLFTEKLVDDIFSVTDDGETLVFALREPDDHSRAVCYALDTASGEITALFEKRFQPPFAITNHYMVNPKNRDQVFFAHEGNTFYVSNRLWLFEKDNGVRCIAKQRLDDDGNLGDCFGHECWAADGTGLWFVKYPCSPLPPRGLCFAGVDGRQTDVQYGGYPYWHVCCAPNNRYLAADTQGPGYSSVCVIDTQTGKEAEAYRAGFVWSHPAHPHPAFSPSSEQVIFHDLKDGQLTLGIVRTADVLR